MISVLSNIRLWLSIMVQLSRVGLQNPWDSLLGLTEGILYQVTTLLVIILVLPSIDALDGWTYPELLLLSGIRMVAHAIYMPLFNNIYELSEMLREQEIDRFLSRPRGLLFQISCARFNINFLGDAVAAAVVLVLALRMLDVAWSPGLVVLLVFLIASGVATEAAMQIVAGSFTLRDGYGEQSGLLASEAVTRFGSYPLSIFHPVIHAFLSVFLPVGFVAYAQTHIFLAAAGGDPWAGDLALTISAVCLFGLVAWAAWRAAQRRYQRGTV